MTTNAEQREQTSHHVNCFGCATCQPNRFPKRISQGATEDTLDQLAEADIYPPARGWTGAGKDRFFKKKKK